MKHWFWSTLLPSGLLLYCWTAAIDNHVDKNFSTEEIHGYYRNTSITPSTTYHCLSDRNCSYNGICNKNQSKCICENGWKGQYCESLKLASVYNGSGLQELLTNDKISTWGGSVIYVPFNNLEEKAAILRRMLKNNENYHGDNDNESNGFYHMYYSEILNHCGIHRWVTNSIVSHAISRGPIENWKFHKLKELFPSFTHTPMIVQDPRMSATVEKSFGLFVTHYPNGSAADSPVCFCIDGSTSSAIDTKCRNSTEPSRGQNKTMNTYYTTAPTPYGPWKQPLISLERQLPEGNHVDLNFAPILYQNGSLLAWTRWDIIYATNWLEANTYVNQGQAPNFNDPNGHWEGEDPSLWQDSKGRYHILSHNGARGQGGTSDETLGDCGRHLFSETGNAGSWITAPSPLGGCAYPRVNVSFNNDGTIRSFYRRERPHLIFDGKGRPVALSTAVIDSPIGPHMPHYQPPQRDASYTMIQAIILDDDDDEVK